MDIKHLDVPGKRTVQEILGNSILATIHDFSAKNIPSVTEWQNEIKHVSDVALRQTIAEVLYGTLFVYKLGLVTLSQGDELLALVRAQISEHGAVCEAILVDMLVQKKRKYPPHTLAKKPQYPINCTYHNAHEKISLCGMHWIIDTAFAENIISANLQNELHKLRKKRNEVHLYSRKRYSFINTAKNCFTTTKMLITETSVWQATL
ncbi:MAG: hypothetical protein LBS65_01655 [Desulfovibrio sp.]|jgi:hypothetical protein|nr:hypothetical protein [Desulfovibrio sp.]